MVAQSLTTIKTLRNFLFSIKFKKNVYRFSSGQRTTVLTALDWNAENNNEIAVLFKT